MGHPEEVDIIVAGGGPAGCVVAGRLAYADPNLKVMLIEGGANNRDDPWVYRPGIYVKNMQRDGINDKATFYTDTMQSSHLRGRQSIVPCANILGGGSSINFQMYTRASASDWDDFKTNGWKAEGMLLFRLFSVHTNMKLKTSCRLYPASPAAAKDIDIRTAKQLLPNAFTVGIHMGTWHNYLLILPGPGEEYNASKVHEDIKYTEEDDKAIDDWIADHVETIWHSLETCAMKPREEGGVVDPRLKRLRYPEPEGRGSQYLPGQFGNQHLLVGLMILNSRFRLVGEKGADLIAEELGIKIKTPHAPVPHAPIPTGKPATQQVR
ncbi:FAD/NAD(P)-binding domain-containing protein [Hymenopellis radicata]|nr:FAD/NAD(P)-binding domain-containing protein [Hymenopellis radicata]